jgi:hypothetical protein
VAAYYGNVGGFRRNQARGLERELIYLIGKRKPGLPQADKNRLIQRAAGLTGAAKASARLRRSWRRCSWLHHSSVSLLDTTNGAPVGSPIRGGRVLKRRAGIT